MNKPKTAQEIEILRDNNLLVSKTLAEVAKHVRPGVTTADLDRVAEEFIRDHGAVPGFLGYQGYPKTLCTSVNACVVHGIPSETQVLNEGDIVSVDCGTFKDGFYGDSAYTFAVGEIAPEVADLLKYTKESLQLAAQKAVEKLRMGDIASTVQKHVEAHGFSVVREMVGHGLGRNLHERPDVPNYGTAGSGKKLVAGMVLCIEPMINLGKRQVYIGRDGWSIMTLDGKPSAHFEYAVAVGQHGPDILTTFSYVEEVLKQQGQII